LLDTQAVSASQEHAVERFAQAWREQSAEPIAAAADPGIVLDWSNSIGPLRGVYRGLDEVTKLFHSFGEAWEEVHWEGTDITNFGADTIVMRTSVGVRGHGSGVETTAQGAQVWTFAGEKVTRVKMFQSHADALGWLRRERLERARLYFVCEHGAGPAPMLRAALAGGADMVQLREKSPRCEEELVAFAEPFRRAASEAGALFVLNDEPGAVPATGADGVHVGQDDSPVAEARAIAGPGAVVGLSTHSPEQLDAACAAQGDARPDYVSVGPVWETPTKPGRSAAGLDYVRYAAEHADLPWFAIGGIDETNITEVVASGAERAVVVRAIRDAADPEAAARALREALPRENAAHG
jgi:thiamine-phosphate pyrophosphorylase